MRHDPADEAWDRDKLSLGRTLLVPEGGKIRCLWEEVERLLELPIDFGVDLVGLLQPPQRGYDRLLDFAPDPFTVCFDVSRRPLQLA